MALYKVYTWNEKGERRLSHVLSHWSQWEKKKKILEARKIKYELEKS